MLADHFLKINKQFKNFKEQGIQTIFTKMNFDKDCFQHDIAYGNFKDLLKRTASDKILKDKAFKVVKNPKYDGYQRGLASMVYKFFDKKSAGSGVNTHANKSSFNDCPLDLTMQKLAEEIQKPIIRKFNKRIVNSGFKDNNWGADLADK